MKNEMLAAIKAILAADPETTPDTHRAVIRALNPVEKPRPGTVREAAEILDCNTRTIDRYAAQGLIHKIRISPRRVRYDLRDVERLALFGAEAMEGGTV